MPPLSAAKLCRIQRADHISGALAHAMQSGAFIVGLQGVDHAVSDARLQSSALHLSIDGDDFDAAMDWFPGRSLLILRKDERETVFQLARTIGGYRLVQGGHDALLTVRRPAVALLAAMMPQKAPPDTSRLLLCPMPGLVTAVHAVAGQAVKAGETLAVVEAMKMENILRATRDGIVTKLCVKKGDTLAREDVILEFA